MGGVCLKLSFPVEAVVKEDSRIPAISVVSILAKVARDQEIVKYEKQYPVYDFAEHKGYATSPHLKAIYRLGFFAYSSKKF
ncbi:hypothetical protein [Coxiella-like endosymbiont]|uniref:hypothetical protein n=1 Tax=Coxiella-like endosymbiont TaxID=1592897 RepID=UPI00272C633D|nr:hypothetical protein [Coxiella-like endosymbiont]